MVRYSKQKEAILKVLKSTTSHPTADWIYEQVRKEMPHISLGTVYRNLKLLAQEGRILELELAGAPGRFDGNTQDHYHLKCVQCGCIFDVDEPIHKEIDRRIARKMSSEIYYHRLEFNGLCKECRLQFLTEKIVACQYKVRRC